MSRAEQTACGKYGNVAPRHMEATLFILIKSLVIVGAFAIAAAATAAPKTAKTPWFAHTRERS